MARSRQKDIRGQLELDKSSYMTLKEFRALYDKPEEKFDFAKFHITCKKCGGDDIELAGATQLDSSNCYYSGDTSSATSVFVCKCHACGNACAVKDDNTQRIKDAMIEDMQARFARWQRATVVRGE